ncbi:winged helix-turn-helix domain-containing protein [Tenacibaculum sp. TC6]|uniref:winged helix-turn-helix domain-containing protein n=1 Tax=Tenacibaculum sp. TC6 TaxID=3423223 RepID=UPI003D364326
MKYKSIYVYRSLAVILLLGWVFLGVTSKEDDFSERVKVSLRDVGNQLLLLHKDSTSLVLPIRSITPYKFELSFEKSLSFDPSSLIVAVKNSFKKADLPTYYRVEVVQCTDKEVAYSYEIKNESEKDIIPCRGRYLPDACYTIEVVFTRKSSIIHKNSVLIVGVFLLVVLFLLDFFLFRRKKRIENPSISNTERHISLGRFLFFPEQNKLMLDTSEINLSKKECELLFVLSQHINQIVKRDELSKKIWEDNGVFVGRSLDTYISKLRKKLKDDVAIKITNVHGVGYKLEIDR